MSIIIPGDSLASEIADETQITIGPGVYKYPKTQEVIPLQAGLLKLVKLKKNENLLYIESNTKRYIPQVNDYVVGIVTGVTSEAFKVSLQAHSQPVQLSMMAFPNASKKNRPNLRVGLAVYARVAESVVEIDTEIECIDPETGKEGGFGPLDESGYIFEVNMNFARELLFNKSSIFMEKLATKVAFEVAIGINGKVWIKCGGGLIKSEEKDDSEMDDGEEDISARDMRLTLAAARYLTACQFVLKDNASDELKKAFRGEFR